jgi:hypothetical protein
VDRVDKGEIREAALRLLAQKGARFAEPASLPEATARACEALVACLAQFVGPTGSTALYERSVALTRRLHPWLGLALSTVEVTRWVRLQASLEAHQDVAEEASLALLTSLLELFSTLVGRRLAVRILHAQLPDVFPLTAPEVTP